MNPKSKSKIVNYPKEAGCIGWKISPKQWDWQGGPLEDNVPLFLFLTPSLSLQQLEHTSDTLQTKFSEI